MAFRWGPLIEEETYKNQQRLYLLEQTDGSVPNTLVIANVEVVKPRVAASEHISKFNEEARSPFVRKFKTIIHLGVVYLIFSLLVGCIHICICSPTIRCQVFFSNFGLLYCLDVR